MQVDFNVLKPHGHHREEGVLIADKPVSAHQKEHQEQSESEAGKEGTNARGIALLLLERKFYAFTENIYVFDPAAWVTSLCIIFLRWHCY